MTVATALVDLLILVSVPLNWFVTIMLWRISRRAPDIDVLRERAGAATAVTLIVTIFCVVFLNNDLDTPILVGDDVKLVARGAMLLLSVIPALFWLRLYWKGEM